MKAHIVQPEDIAYIWDQVAPLLERVKEHSEGELETDDFLEPLTHGDMQLWIATEDQKMHSAMVTPDCSLSTKTGVAGNFNRWL